MLAAQAKETSKEDVSQCHKKLDQLKYEAIVPGDKQCCTYKSGKVDFSPEVILQEKRCGVWRLTERKLGDADINTAYIKRIANNVD